MPEFNNQQGLFESTLEKLKTGADKIDPEVLGYIRKLKSKNIPHYIDELSETHFVKSALDFSFHNFLLDCFRGQNIKDILTNLEKNKYKFDDYSKNYYNIPEDNNPKILEEAARDLLANICLAMPMIGNESGDGYRAPFRDLEYDKDGKIITGDTFKVHKKEQRLTDIMRSHLKSRDVVDLGAGRCSFFWAASLFDAKNYIAIDDPRGEGDETEMVSKDMEWKLKIFNIPLKILPNKKISMDILEALYTKIKSNSSCFVIFALDECYQIKGEYIKLTNQLIADRTEVGGIVLSFESVLGRDMPSDDFKVIEKDDSPFHDYVVYQRTR